MRVVLFRYGIESNMDSIAQAFKKIGCDVLLIGDDAFDDFSQLLMTLKNFDPHFYLTHNRYFFRHSLGKELEQWIKNQNRVLCYWFWDSPFASGSMSDVHQYIFGGPVDSAVHFVVDRKWDEELKQRGYQSYYLPIGIDERLLEFKSKSNKYAGQVCFVGKPWADIEQELKQTAFVGRFFLERFFGELLGLCESKRDLFPEGIDLLRDPFSRIRMQLIPVFDKNHWTVSEFENSLNNFYSNLVQRIPVNLYRILILLRGRLEMIYSWGQLTRLVQSLESQNIQVYGGDEWRKYYLNTSSSPRLSDLELLECFQQAAVQVCYTKWQFTQGLHERPLMVYALGGLPLTDERSALHECFEKDEVITYSSEQDCIDKIVYLKSRSDVSEKLKSKGRLRVKQSHTYRHRAQEMIRLLGDLI